MNLEATISREKHDKDHPFVIISREMMTDTSISPKAKGILIYILGQRDDWKIYHSQLCSALNIGKDYLASGIQELLDAGYAIRNREKIKGKFQSYAYFVSEKPKFKKKIPERENRSGKTAAENPPLTDNNLNENKTTVCSEAPPVAVPSPSESLSVCIKKHPDGHDIKISFQEVFEKAIAFRFDWNAQEIEESWKILCDYKGPVRDILKFIEGTITNIRKAKQNLEITRKIQKEKKCRYPDTKISNTQYNQPKEKSSENDTSGQAWQKFLYQMGLKNFYNPSLDPQKTS